MKLLSHLARIVWLALLMSLTSVQMNFTHGQSDEVTDGVGSLVVAISDSVGQDRDGDRAFLLGVECDGVTYHSARSARDRDRLREEIVRSRGWEIHRIWSTDWFLNQKAEEEKLKQAILNVTDDLHD